MRDGTLAPLLRASDRPIAIACFLLLTFFPERPDLSVPCFCLCIARLTLLDAVGPYFRFETFLAIADTPLRQCPRRVFDLCAVRESTRNRAYAGTCSCSLLGIVFTIHIRRESAAVVFDRSWRCSCITRVRISSSLSGRTRDSFIHSIICATASFSSLSIWPCWPMSQSGELARTFGGCQGSKALFRGSVGKAYVAWPHTCSLTFRKEPIRPRARYRKPVQLLTAKGTL